MTYVIECVTNINLHAVGRRFPRGIPVDDINEINIKISSEGRQLGRHFK